MGLSFQMLKGCVDKYFINKVITSDTNELVRSINTRTR